MHPTQRNLTGYVSSCSMSHGAFVPSCVHFVRLRNRDWHIGWMQPFLGCVRTLFDHLHASVFEPPHRTNAVTHHAHRDGSSTFGRVHPPATPPSHAIPSRGRTTLACNYASWMLQACVSRTCGGGPTHGDVHHSPTRLVRSIHVEHERDLDGTRTFADRSTEVLRFAREVRTVRCRGSWCHGLPRRSGLGAETLLCGLRPLKVVRRPKTR